MEKITTMQATPSMLDCTAETAAPSLSRSQVRRATAAVVPMLKPMATAITITSMPSVMPTVAVASAPRWATQNMSTMPNNASIAISRTMGTASKMMARLIEIAGKSWREPKIASLTRDRNVAVRDCWEVFAIELSRLSIMLLSKKYCAEAETQL